jgi:dTDP-4-dehydrorhamnose reductase
MKSYSPLKEGRHNIPAGKVSIVVTGAGGQLGMELRELSASYPQYNFIFLTHHELAIEDAHAVNLFFKTNQPKYCVNCAAYTAVDKAESEKEQAFLINASAAGLLAAACKTYGTRLIHISTDYVFDATGSVPYKEDAATNPQSVYGASKLEGEKLALQNDPGSIIIRTSWVYSSYGKNFVKTMLKLMNEKDEVNVVNDQYGSPTYAADLAQTTVAIIANCQLPIANCIPGIYHYCNEGTISWYDFALAIKELAGLSCAIHPITTAQYPTAAKRPSYSVLDTTKIQKTFGVELKDWKKSLAECINKTGNILSA